MGNLDFLEKKPSNIVITTTTSELSTLSCEAANCLPALSIQTIYSKLGLTTTNVGDELHAATNCAVRISSDVSFTPNSNGKIYKDYSAEYYFVETAFNIVNFANGVVYTYTKGNISAADDPAPCIIIPKTFTDSESSAVFEKGVYLGIGVYSGGQTFYTKFEQKIVGTSINISGKGFTSPQKPYRYVSRFVKPDDDVCIWINTARIPETDEEKLKGYNSICKPEDFNSEADIKLNEDLAFLFHCSDIMIVNEVQQYGNDSNTNIMLYGFNVMLRIGYSEGLYISHDGEVIFFDPNISEDDYYNWKDKYFKNPRP